MGHHLSLTDVTLRNAEPRIYDLTLAKALCFERDRKIRELIERNLDELATHGEVRPTAGQTTDAGGRPGTEYWLNEPQALLVTMFARTARAAEARKEIIDVFMAWRISQTIPPAPDAPEPFPSEERTRVEGPGPAPIFGEDWPAPVLQARVAVANAAHRIFGPARAATLWTRLGLPAIPTAADARHDSVPQNAWGALDVILAAPGGDRPLGWELRWVMLHEFAADDSWWSVRGFRLVFGDEPGVIVANTHPELEKIYRGTRFRDAAWGPWLKRLPGAQIMGGRSFGGKSSRGVFLPADLFERAEADMETTERPFIGA